MSAVKYQDLILDAIDQLRHRKARPAAEKIYNSLFRRHSISCADAKIALDKCVEMGVVLRVSYKGNISYRNAAKKYSHLKRDSLGEIIRVPGKPRRKFTSLLTSAFAELFIQEPDYLEIGVPLQELIRSILSKDNVRYTKRYLSILLEKEVELGGLIKMENGNFLVGPNKPEKRPFARIEKTHPLGLHKILITTSRDDNNENEKKKIMQSPNFKKEKSVENTEHDEHKNEILRIGSRKKNITEMNRENIRHGVKKAKKVFDPSESNVPKKRGRPIGSLNKSTLEKRAKSSDSDSRPESRNSQNGREQGGVCYVCRIHSKKGPEKMIPCRECSNKAHISCLNGDDMMLKMSPDNTWLCPHCKTCVICYETSDAGSLIVCSICADGYHMTCHTPKIEAKHNVGSKWLCINCQMPEQLAVDHIQIGYNIESAKTSQDDVSSHSHVSRMSSPANLTTPPPSPTPPMLSPQTVLTNQDHSPEGSEYKSSINSYKEYDLEENIDPTIPDATNWTSEEVYQYFVQYFPEEAIVFKEQEIDGHSLLLMKRMDVLKGLELKLGPALKIYRHVLKLQYRRDDPKIYWV